MLYKIISALIYDVDSSSFYVKFSITLIKHAMSYHTFIPVVAQCMPYYHNYVLDVSSMILFRKMYEVSCSYDNKILL